MQAVRLAGDGPPMPGRRRRDSILIIKESRLSSTSRETLFARGLVTARWTCSVRPVADGSGVLFTLCFTFLVIMLY